MLTFGHQVIKDAAKTKHIYFLSFVSVFELIVTLIEDHLSGLPSNATLNCLSMVGFHLSPQLLGEAHVRQLYFHQAVYQNIRRFDVSVNDVVLVQKSHPLKNLGNDNPHEFWRGEKVLLTLEEIA